MEWLFSALHTKKSYASINLRLHVTLRLERSIIKTELGKIGVVVCFGRHNPCHSLERFFSVSTGGLSGNRYDNLFDFSNVSDFY
jgi:hypothetical protein